MAAVVDGVAGAEAAVDTTTSRDLASLLQTCHLKSRERATVALLPLDYYYSSVASIENVRDYSEDATIMMMMILFFLLLALCVVLVFVLLLLLTRRRLRQDEDQDTTTILLAGRLPNQCSHSANTAMRFAVI